MRQQFQSNKGHPKREHRACEGRLALLYDMSVAIDKSVFTSVGAVGVENCCVRSHCWAEGTLSFRICLGKWRIPGQLLVPLNELSWI